MSDPTCKSLEALVPIAAAKLSKALLPEQFETYRSELHRELARHWPFRSETSHPLNVAPVASKSTAHATLGAPQKPAFVTNDDDSVHQANSKLRSNNLTPLNVEIAPRIVAANSDVSLEGAQPPIEWNVKAQEGIITYRLPDGLPDGLVLHDKLQQLMKTSTIYLNDRRFWNTLEERFKARRKHQFRQNMERLRQAQQQYEQELIAKGALPHTTEDAIRLLAEHERTLMAKNQTPTDPLDRRACLSDYAEARDEKKNDNELDAFETDNVHPRFHQIFNQYQFQTKLAKDIGEKHEDDLYRAQGKIKTIFPRINQRDLLRQQLHTMKTSEGLYAYSNRLAKKVVP